MMAGRIEYRIHSEECNRVDWRSTLRYAATAKRRWERDLLLLAFLFSPSDTVSGAATINSFLFLFQMAWHVLPTVVAYSPATA
jgi:hypothetical protein